MVESSLLGHGAISPKALSIDSMTQHHNQQLHSWQRLRISGFDLIFRNSFASVLFDSHGLAFHYPIQLVRFGTAILGTELWGTSFMKTIAAV